jgi:hypothetical protein
MTDARPDIKPTSLITDKVKEVEGHDIRNRQNDHE